jgi:hypothetical protein
MPIGTLALLTGSKARTTLAVGKVVKGLVKTGMKYRESFLKKKVNIFLETINDLSDKERLSMMKMIDDDQESFYSRLWDIIDKNDTEYKTAIVARLTKAFARKLIDVDELFVLCKIVNDCHTSDLEYAYNKAMHIPVSQKQRKRRLDTVFRLANVGISRGQGVGMLTDIGKLLFTHGFEKTPAVVSKVTLD